MSKVYYKVGEEAFSYESKLQFLNKEHLFILEEHLREEIKEHKHHLNPQPRTGYIHDVEFVDDNGIVGTISDFITPGNLTIKENEL